MSFTDHKVAAGVDKFPRLLHPVCQAGSLAVESVGALQLQHRAADQLRMHST